MSRVDDPGRRAQLPHLPTIDGLRAVAVVAVVAYHAGVPGFSGGFVGVDVFFVISGFLISRLLFDAIAADGKIDLVEFWARRIRRILPALMVVVLATLAAIPWVSFTVEYLHETSAAGSAAALFYSNFFYWQHADRYFSKHHDLLPLLHTWSLAIEEQFYLAWPLLLAALLVLGRYARKRFEGLSAVALMVLCAVSLAIAVWATWSRPLAAFYLMPSRAWEFAVGGLLALNAARLQRVSPRWGAWLAAIGLAGVAVSVHAFDAADPYPGVLALLPVLSSALIIAACAGEAPHGLARVLAMRPMVFVGLLSYSWYLWHWPLLSLRRMYFLGDRSLAMDLLVCVVALGLAYLTYRFIEQPVRSRRLGFLHHQGGTYAFGLMLCVAGFAGAQGLRMAGSQMTPSPFAAAASDLSPLQRRCNLEGEFLGLPAPRSACVAGAPDQSIRVVVWGDSHASHLMPMVEAFFGGQPGSALQRTRSACAPLLNASSVSVVFQGGVDAHCIQFNEAVVAELKQLSTEGLRGVIINARWAMYLTEPPPNPHETVARALTRVEAPARTAAGEKATLGVWPHDKPGSLLTLRLSLRDTFARLEQLGLKALVVAPTPEMYFPVPECLAKHSERTCGAQRSAFDERRRDALLALRETAAGFKGVEVWDPVDSLCDAQTCFAAQNGVVIYSDEHHFTATWSRHLMGELAPALHRLVAPDGAAPAR